MKNKAAGRPKIMRSYRIDPLVLETLEAVQEGDNARYANRSHTWLIENAVKELYADQFEQVQQSTDKIAA